MNGAVCREIEMNSTPFNSHTVIEEKISEASLRSYLVGFDLNDLGKTEYRWSAFIQRILSAVHEFAYGHHEGTSTDITETLSKITDAAKSIYKIDHYQKVKDIYENDGHIEDELEDKYLRRGEFGELILHLLLRDFHNTLPLLSKIYFKDSLGHAVHGFDAVHVEPTTKTLWLGESKLYIDPKRGVSELVNDIKEHFKSDYLEAEFALISKKIKSFETFPEIERWRQLISGTEKLKNKLKAINIPLLCVYTCDNFSKFNDEDLPEFITEYEKKIREIKKYFDEKNDHPLKTNLNIILLLFPVKCKKTLVKKLHHKLSLLQAVGDNA